jgi:cytoskeletal protein CcmA (bactofilin family)
MWKKNDAPIPQQNKPSQPAAPSQPSAPAASAAPQPAPVQAHTPQPDKPARAESASTSVTIGASVVIKGEVSAREDLTISGRIEGKVEVRDHIVRVGRESHVHAEISARTVIIEGNVKGNVTATERIELLEHGAVEGDISAPKVAMAEGAQFRGKIDMAKRSAEIRKSA